VLLKIAREEGLAAMNMRRVAAELNVSSRLLYHYMRDKDEMIDIMSDAITAQNMPDLSSPDWETRLRNVVMAARRAYVAGA
jgi:AcrR family transcriptional regulator